MSDITHYMNASAHLMASWAGPGSLKVWKWLSLSFFLLLFFLFSKKGFPCGSKSMLAVLSTRMTRLHQQTFWHLLQPFYPTVLYCREHKIINISFWNKLQGDFEWMSEGVRFIQSKNFTFIKLNKWWQNISIYRTLDEWYLFF
jgi:hypothetical protein